MPPPRDSSADGPPKIGPPPSYASPKTPGKKSPDDIIIFFCTCGHKLNAPRKLQGRPAQCPHCGMKLRVPTDDELAAADDDEAGETFPSVEEAPGESVTEQEEVEEFEDEVEELPVSESFAGEEDIEAAPEEELTEEAAAVTPIAAFAEDAHAMARIFATLWHQRGEEGIVEVFLQQGEMFSPDFFSPELSQSTHAVFATREEDGSYTLTSVPWDAVAKAVLRKFDRLPEGLFT